MSESIEEKMVSVNQKELSLLVTNIIPTSKYFELRFDNMQEQISDLKGGQKDIRLEMDKRFEQVDKRFEQVDLNQKEFRLEMDKRFEQVDKRFEQVDLNQKEFRLEMDKRFEQVDKRFEQVDKRFEQVDLNQKEFRRDMDKRFEQVDLNQKEFRRDMDNRFEQVNGKLDQIMDRIDIKIDTGLREGRLLTVKLFSFAMVFSAISMAGLLAKMTGLF